MKMRPSFIVSGLILLCAVSAPAQNLQSTTEPAVRQVLQRQQEAWNQHDLESFMSGYWKSPELTFFSGAKISSGWQATIERYRKTYQREGREMGKLEFSGLNVEVLAADAALVRGAWHLTMSDGKTPHGLFTLIFRKFPDRWKIIHDHTSAAE
jgi:uncharacterized protein (TIGR02246 family)